MKNVSVKYSMLAMVAVVTMCVFSACGGDDDTPEGDTSIGVHRIDIQINDNGTGCEVLNIFYGIRRDGSYANIYENGKKLELDAATHTWYTEEVRELSIQTEDGCGAIVASINITGPNGRNVTKDVTVSLVGYVNGKLLKSQTFTLPAGHHIMSAAFSTDTMELHEEVSE